MRRSRSESDPRRVFQPAALFLLMFLVPGALTAQDIPDTLPADAVRRVRDLTFRQRDVRFIVENVERRVS